MGHHGLKCLTSEWTGPSFTAANMLWQNNVLYIFSTFNTSEVVFGNSTHCFRASPSAFLLPKWSS